jgi:hypothetical protein
MDAEERRNRRSTANLAALIHVLVLVAIIWLGYRRSIAADPGRYPHEIVFETMIGVWCILLASIYLLAKVKAPPLRAVLQLSVPMLLIASLLIIADQFPVGESSEPAIAREHTESIPMPAVTSTMMAGEMAESTEEDTTNLARVETIRSAEGVYSVSLSGETIIGMPTQLTGASNKFQFKNTSENGLRLGFYARDTTSGLGTMPEPGAEPMCAPSCGRLVAQLEIKKGTTRTYFLVLAPGTYSIACIELSDEHQINRCTPIVFTVRTP